MVRVEVSGDDGLIGTIAELTDALSAAAGRRLCYDDVWGLISFLRQIGAARKVGFRATSVGRRANLWQLPAVVALRSSP